MKDNNINSAELARKINKTRQNVYDMYKRDDMEVKLLLTVSDALNHNFLEDIYPQDKNIITIDAFFDTIKKMVKEEILTTKKCTKQQKK